MSLRRAVRVLDTSSEPLLPFLHDPRTRQYFAPYNPACAQAARLHGMGITGKGTLAAIVDTGLLSHHPLLRGKIVDAVDFTGEGPEDRNGHGTIVALIFLATAPDAGLLNVKVLDQRSAGLEEDLVAGLRWAAARGAMVVNLSLGIERVRSCGGTCAVCRTARHIHGLGVIVVAAAGHRPDRFYCPASSGDVIAVGAVEYTGSRRIPGAGKGSFPQAVGGRPEPPQRSRRSL